MNTSVTPFLLNIPEDQLVDLRRRLATTRWPEKETVTDWSQGIPLNRIKSLCNYWQNHYDWRRIEETLNSLGQFTTEIDGLKIHFLHIRSTHREALPMILTHGWPGSIVEFLKVIGPLVDPPKFGGVPVDAFHLVIPCLPGYGFTERPTKCGWNLKRTALAWTELMSRLGYDRFVAQGGDWGAMVAHEIALLKPPSCLAVHTNFSVAMGVEAETDLTDEEKETLRHSRQWHKWEAGYAAIQSTRPQTIGYGLTDSPAFQAAWIYEKMRALMDCDGDPENAVSKDEILDNIMMYWLSATGTSSARYYWENYETVFHAKPIDFPFGLSIFPKEVLRPSRRWAERHYSNIIYWNQVERGGHFAAFEQPDLFVREVRNCFNLVR